MLKRIISAFCCLLILSTISISVVAEETAQATDLSGQCKISGSGYDSFSFLTDKKQTKYNTSGENARIDISCDTEISSLYIVFGKNYGEYTLSDRDSGRSVTVGTNNFLHEYIDIVDLFGYKAKNISLIFGDKKASICEIFAFSSGTLPDFVEQWNLPEDGKTDLLLFSTHGDDDQLYFAGLLPHYAVDKGYNVQVVYMTGHQNNSELRMHEMLGGLWAVGIKNYPVFGEFADFRIDDKEKTYKRYEELGTSYDDLLGFVTEQIRRFKPLVTVGHDFKGEYGHGMHMVFAELVSKAIVTANDDSAFVESAQKYGTWQIQKAYFHLYKENPIVLDLDTPKDCFGGLSAFQMAQKYGFPCHVSQQQHSFKDWLNGKNGEITKATQIKSYNPANYGLYFSSVGDDIAKDDMFENVKFREPEVIEPPAEPDIDNNTTDTSEQNSHTKNNTLIVIIILFVSVLAVLYAIIIRRKQLTK